MNPTSAFVDLACYSQDLSKDETLKTNTMHTFLPENFLKDDDNLNTLFDSNIIDTNKLINITSEKPYIQKYDNSKINESNDTIEYTFKCCHNVDSIYDFSLYFSQNLKCDDIVKIEVYTTTTTTTNKDENNKEQMDEVKILEEISKEFLVCWNRLFYQPINSNGMFYLPIFLNRYKLHYYNLYSDTVNKKYLNIKVVIKQNSIITDTDLYLCYKTQLYSNKVLSVLQEKIKSKEHFYYYDRICDYSFYRLSEKKWMNIKCENKNSKTIDLRFNEPCHRLSDLFIIFKSTTASTTNSVKLVKSFSLYYEETLSFKLPGEVCGTLISPLSYSDKIKYSNDNKDELFAPEIKEVYYIPFSSSVTLFEEYKPRSYTNTSGMANMAFVINFNEKLDECILEQYEVCLCYMSPVKMSC